MLTRDKLSQLLDEHGFGDHKQQILEQCQPAIHIVPTRVEDESTIPIGASKLGGSPDLPEGFEWFQWEDKPLIFIGQFRLSEVAPFDTQDLLPKSGLLYFFYSEEWEIFGDPESWGGWEVLYYEDENLPLKRYPHPVDESPYDDIKAMTPCMLTYEPLMTLPHWQSSFYELLAQKMKLKPWDVTDKIFDIKHGRHWFFGLADAIQGDVLKECVVYGNNLTWDDWKREEVKKQTDDWQLLLQINSDDALDKMWSDGGCLYFCIRKEDLKARKFEKTWVTMQCG